MNMLAVCGGLLWLSHLLDVYLALNQTIKATSHPHSHRVRLSAACPVELYRPGHQQHKRVVVNILYICRAYESHLDNSFGKHAVKTSPVLDNLTNRSTI
jgi:hypothetical protein